MVSSCPSCSRERDSFVCRGCLTKLLKLYKSQAASHNSLLPAAQARAVSGIKVAETTRRLEAVNAAVRSRKEAIQTESSRLEALIEEASTLVRLRRQHLKERKARLAAAKLSIQVDTSHQPMHDLSNPRSEFVPSLSKIKLQQDDLQHQLAEITAELVGTRQILLQEVLEALQVTSCSVPDCSYQIACLPVPPLLHIQELPKHQFNATLSLITLLVRLEAHYLGIQLPFVLLGTPTKPLIQALSSTLNAARYPKAYPLYMSSGTSSSTPPPPVGNLSSRPSVAQSATPASHAQALKTGLQMLTYDAFYVMQTTRKAEASASPTPVSKTVIEGLPDFTDILSLLDKAGHSQAAGKLSHINAGRTYTLRDVDSPSGLADFSSFLHLLEDKDNARLGQVGAKSQKEKKKGKYVVVSAPGEPVVEQSAPETLQANTHDEGWDLV